MVSCCIIFLNNWVNERGILINGSDVYIFFGVIGYGMYLFLWGFVMIWLLYWFLCENGGWSYLGIGYIVFGVLLEIEWWLVLGMDCWVGC